MVNNLLRSFRQASIFAEFAVKEFEKTRTPRFRSIWESSAKLLKDNYVTVYHGTSMTNAFNMIKQAEKDISEGGKGKLNSEKSNKMRKDAESDAQIYIGYNLAEVAHRTGSSDPVGVFLVSEDSICTDQDRGTDYVKQGHDVILQKFVECSNLDEINKPLEEKEQFYMSLIPDRAFIYGKNFIQKIIEELDTKE